MRFHIFLVLVVSQLCPPAAHAGAWLREKGTGFTAISFSTTYSLNTSNGAYLEYGLRENLTLGADIRLSRATDGTQEGFATVFMRRPLNFGEGKNTWAYGLGLGAAWQGDLVSPHVKTGLSWGRGIKLREKGGWMSADASVRWAVGQGDHLIKIDTTLGLNFTDVTTGMLQLYVSHAAGETSAKLAPSVVLNPRKRKFRIQIGAESPLDDPKNTALKVGLWRKF